MISKEFIKTELKKLNDQFNFIFSNNSISSSINSDQTLQSILKECLSIYCFLEKSSKTTKKNSKLFIEAYNKLSNEDFVLSDVKYEKEADILDQLNWMKVYCENTYNVDILSHAVSAVPVAEIKTKKVELEEKVVSAGAGADLNPDKFIELSQKMQRVNERLNNDIASGKIYIFKTKPKHIVTIKKIYSFLLAFLSFALLVLSVSIFIVENTRTTGSQQWIQWYDGLVALFVCGICVMMTVQNFMSLYNKKLNKNDNIKYQFKWQISILIFIILLMYMVNFCLTSLNPITTIFSLIKDNVMPNLNSTQKIEVYIFEGAIFAMFAFYVLALIPFIIGAVLNPKRDDKVIEAKMAEYLKDPTI